MYKNGYMLIFIALFISISDLKADWALQNPSITPQQLRCIFFLNSSIGWIGSSTGGIFKTVDSGKTWAQQKTPKNNWVYSIHFIDEKHGWAVGSFCVLHTNNGGENWEEKTIDAITSRVAKKVYFKNSKQGYIILDSPLNNFATTHDSGNTWQFQTIGNHNLYDLQFTDESHAFLCGDTYLGRSLDSGTTWTIADTFPHELERIVQLQMIDSSFGYAISRYGICKTIDGGKTWLQVLDIPFDGIPYVTGHFISPLEGFCMYGYIKMILFRTSDGGLTWDTLDSQLLSEITNVYFPEKSRGIGIADDGAIYSLNQRGENVEKISKGNVSDINSIDFYDSRHGFCNNGLFTMDEGKAWSFKPLINPSVVFDSTTMFSRGSIDSAIFSTNAGLTWNKSPIEPSGINIIQKIPDTKFGAFVLFSDNSLLITKDGGKSFSACSSPGFRVYSAFFLNDKRGWIAGQKFAFTNDGGISWNVCADSLPVAPSFSLKTVFFIDTLIGWIGGSNHINNGGADIYEKLILKTIDGGRTWSRQNNIMAREDFSYNPANGTGPYCILKIRSRDGIRVWALDYISGVLFSEDGGEHWEEQYLPCNNQRFTDMYFHDDNNIWVTAKNSGIWKFSGNYKLPVNDVKNPRIMVPSGIYSRGSVQMNNSKLMVNNPVRGLVQVAVFDPSGRTVRDFSVNKTESKVFFDLGFNVLKKGVYLLRVKSISNSLIYKITKL